MSRFVIASFLFLGWGFYEASGGADFEPPKGPSAAIDIAKAAFAPQPTPARSTAVTAESLVSKVALRPNANTSALRLNAKSVRPAADPTLRSRVAMEQIAAVGNGIGNSDSAFSVSNAGFESGAEAGATIQLASLSNGLSALPSVQNTIRDETSAPQDILLEPRDDIRKITATRVNMRSGPGTVYPVMDRLTNGEEVIVFEDIGTGWLHLRTVKDGKVGWIAASLVSQKRP
ncbi:SH3 domain-containing protein [Phaeobacter porticola]|uniref:Bacterial SH3 domain protein n=1 Tax=Phaeobacter porticola TaxID=1844006 RepID=A0A1L3I1D6_9RHOB|nr:SH3 domain-containing protein [Phaeobacter porticola]APG45807.1 Bacterial SH3 domain protein [Phaeobacter porticola]